MSIEFVVIIQCEISKRRCSGYSCTKSLYEKSGKFTGYPEVEYISFSCGGCDGKGISAKLQHLEKVLKKNLVSQDNVALHFSTCITHDNTHHDRCPNINIMKKIAAKRGFNRVIEGSVINQNAEERRQKGIYRTYE